MKTLQLIVAVVCSVIASARCPTAAAASNSDATVVGLPAGETSVIVEWNAALCAWFDGFPEQASLHAQARLFAMMHLAMREAIRAVGPSGGQATSQAQARLAASTAAREVVGTAVVLDATEFAMLHARHRATVRHEREATRALQLGQQAAASILQRRRTDGWPILAAGEPGAASAAARLLRGPVDANPRSGRDSVWTQLAPFGLKKVQQFEPEPPYFRYGDGLILPNHRLEKRNRIGAPGLVSATVSTFQAWRTHSLLRWNRAAQSLAAQRPATLEEQARVFAVLNTALADALLAGSFWCEGYQAGRANPAYTTIAQYEEFNRQFEAGQMPIHPDRYAPDAKPLAGFPAITAVLAGAAESVLGPQYGGGEAVLVIADGEPPTTLHSAACVCAWAMASNGTSGSDGCISGHDFGFRVGEYIRRQSWR